MAFYFYVIALLVSICNPFTTQAGCKSQLTLAFKYGNHRALGRGSMLTPLWQQPNRLLFAHIVGLLDTDRHQESNVGLGYRQQKHGYILGLYGYYDHRYSTHHYHFHQVTLGLEYLASHFETRFNGYWPFYSKHPLRAPVMNFAKFAGAHYQLLKLNHRVCEYALGGLDAEIGWGLPKTPVHLYAGYYYFKRQSFARLYGPRIRAQMPLRSMLSISAECHYDKLRGFNYFLGFELKASLRSAIDSSNKLARKMTQSPIRDIDIIIQAGEQTIEIDTQTAIPIECYADLDKIRENLNGHYIVTKDIIQVDQKHIPIGSEKAPFTGIIVGVSDDKSQVQRREIRGLVLESNQGKFGLFGYVDHACMGYLSICHQSFNLVNEEQHNNSNWLHSYAIGALVGEANTHNIFICNRNLGSLSVVGHYNQLGGLVGGTRNHNAFFYNSNLGALAITGQNIHLGGIVGNIWKNNTLAYNVNLGTITVCQTKWRGPVGNHIGGIVGPAYTYNLLTHNTNAGHVCESGERYGNIGGIAGSIRDRNICTHNVNVALLSGAQLGGIVSEIGNQNVLAYNFNAGTLVVSHDSSVGGILGNADESNIITYNANSGKIIGKDSTIGGIATNVFRDNIIAYNMNIGELSAYKEGIYNTIGGIVVELKEHNTVHHNINAGAILVDPHGEAGPDPDYPNMNKNNYIGGIVTGLRELSYHISYKYIYYGTSYKPPVYNTITHNIQAGVITVSEQYVENRIGGIIGQHRDFSGNRFEHNIYSSALISHSPTMEKQLQSDPKANLGSDNPFIDVADFSTLPNKNVGLTQNWLLTVKGPMLSWLLRDRALILLQYFNQLKVMHADYCLPLEMMLNIAGVLDDFNYLSITHIQRIYHYAFISVHDLVHNLSQPKCYWSKDDYLAYVLDSHG